MNDAVERFNRDLLAAIDKRVADYFSGHMDTFEKGVITSIDGDFKLSAKLNDAAVATPEIRYGEFEPPVGALALIRRSPPPSGKREVVRILSSLVDLPADVVHPDLAVHDALGLVTETDLTNYRPPFIGCRAYKTAATSLTSGVVTVVALNAERYDPLGWHDNASNNSEINPTIAGYYDLSAQARFEANATGRRNVRVLVNGIAVASSDTFPNLSSVATLNAVALGIFLNGTTDTVEMDVFQSSGGSLDLDQADWISPELVVKLAGV